MNMMKISLVALLTLSALSACDTTPRQYTYQEARKICLDERRDAEGPRGNVTFGATSRGNGFGGATISINDKFIRGLDPDVVYEQCMNRLIQPSAGQAHNT